MQMIQYFGCYEEVCIYRKGWQVQNFGQKQWSESFHLLCESIQTAKWQARWTMKIDAIQTLMNRFNQSRRASLYHSLEFESIQTRKKGKIDADNIWIGSDFLWMDSHVNRFKKTVNRFTVILFRKIWLDSKEVTQGKWTKGMLDMNQWIMNRIKQFTEGFSIYDTTRDTKESQYTMRHSLLGCFNKFLS